MFDFLMCLFMQSPYPCRFGAADPLHVHRDGIRPAGFMHGRRAGIPPHLLRVLLPAAEGVLLRVADELVHLLLGRHA